MFADLQRKAREVVATNPKLRTEIIEILSFVRCEIEDGGSESAECDYGILEIEALLKKGEQHGL